MLKTSLALLITTPFIGLSFQGESPLKQKQSPEGVTLAAEFRGTVGQPIVLVAASSELVRWESTTPGLKFLAAADVDKYLRDGNTTVCCATAPGTYAVTASTSAKAPDGRPFPPGKTTVVIEAGGGK